MKPEEIHLNDWQRIFFGEVPGAFYPEVVLRIVAVYLILMISMRLMGKRMASQLSRNEMIAMVSLAAAIGVPLQSPDRGILSAVVIAAVVVGVQQIVAKLANRNQKLEAVTQGNIAVLIDDSRLNLDQMKKTGITRERAFAQLRSNSIRHLGEVKRLYFEAGGSFTLIRDIDVKPGLGILPEPDTEFISRRYENADQLVCKACGNLLDKGTDKNQACENCGNRNWIRAVK